MLLVIRSWEDSFGVCLFAVGIGVLFCRHLAWTSITAMGMLNTLLTFIQEPALCCVWVCTLNIYLVFTALVFIFLFFCFVVFLAFCVPESCNGGMFAKRDTCCNTSNKFAPCHSQDSLKALGCCNEVLTHTSTSLQRFPLSRHINTPMPYPHHPLPISHQPFAFFFFFGFQKFTSIS